MMDWLTDFSVSMSPVLERIGWVLIHSVWQFAVIAVMASAFGRVLRNRTPNLRYACFTGLFCLFVLTPIMTWFCVGEGQQPNLQNDEIRHARMTLKDSSMDLAQRSATNRQDQNKSPIAENADAVEPTVARKSITSQPTKAASQNSQLGKTEGNERSNSRHVASKALPHSQTGPENALQNNEIPKMTSLSNASDSIRHNLPWLVSIWFLGVVVLLLRPIVGWVLLQRLRKTGVQQPAAEIQSLVKNLTQQMRVRASVEVMVSTLAKVPMVVGYFRPVILLPVSIAANMPTNQIESILAHELSHIRRHDFVVNLFQLLTESFFFYHPAVWSLSNRIRLERENCCDDLAIETTNNRVDYGRALIAVAEQSQSHPNLALSAADGQLLSRIKRVVGMTPIDSPRLAWPMLVSFAIILTLVTTIGFPATNRASIGSDFAQQGAPKSSQSRSIWNPEYWKNQSSQLVAFVTQSASDTKRVNDHETSLDISFLEEYPKLKGISYEIGGLFLAKYLKSQEIPYRRFFTKNGYENYLFNADSTHCIRVAFGPYGNCAKIEKFRSSVRQEMVETFSHPTFMLPDLGYISAVGLDPNTNHLVSVSPWHYVTVKRWDVKTKELISEIKLKGPRGDDENRGAIKFGRPFLRHTIQLSPDTSKLLLATYDYVGLWDTKTGDLIRKLNFPRVKWEYDSIRRISASKDFSVIVGQLATAYERTTRIYDANIIVWDGNTGKQLRIITDKDATIVSDIDLSKDGQTLLTSNGGRARVWNVSNGEMIAEFKNKNDIPNEKVRGYDNYIWSAALSPDGKKLAIGDLRGAKLWDIESKKMLRKMEADYRYSNSSQGSQLAFSDDGKYLLRTGTGSKAKGYYIPIWSTQTGQKHFELITESSCAQFLDGNSRIAVGFEDREYSLGIWQLSGKPSKDDLSYKPTQEANFNTINSRYVQKGEEANKLIEKWKPVWGPKYNHGLQTGIAITNPKDVYQKGDRVSMVVFLRNWKKEECYIDVKSDVHTHLPEIVGADGKAYKLESVRFLGKPPHYRDRLAGGQSYGPFHLSFGIGENPKPGKQIWAPYLNEFPAGELELGFELPLRVSPSKTGDSPAKYDWVEHQHLTGKLKIKIKK